MRTSGMLLMVAAVAPGFAAARIFDAPAASESPLPADPTCPGLTEDVGPGLARRFGLLTGESWLQFPVSVPDAPATGGTCVALKINFVSGVEKEVPPANGKLDVSVYSCVAANGACPSETCTRELSAVSVIGPDAPDGGFVGSPSGDAWTSSQCGADASKVSTAGIFVTSEAYKSAVLDVTWTTYPCDTGVPVPAADTCDGAVDIRFTDGLSTTSVNFDASGASGHDGVWAQYRFATAPDPQLCVEVEPRYVSGTPVVGAHGKDEIEVEMCLLWSRCAVGSALVPFSCGQGRTVSAIVGPLARDGGALTLPGSAFSPKGVIAVRASSTSLMRSQVELDVRTVQCVGDDQCPVPSPSPGASPAASPAASPSPGASPLPPPNPINGELLVPGGTPDTEIQQLSWSSYLIFVGKEVTDMSRVLSVTVKVTSVDWTDAGATTPPLLLPYYLCVSTHSPMGRESDCTADHSTEMRIPENGEFRKVLGPLSDVMTDLPALDAITLGAYVGVFVPDSEGYNSVNFVMTFALSDASSGSGSASESGSDSGSDSGSTSSSGSGSSGSGDSSDSGSGGDDGDKGKKKGANKGAVVAIVVVIVLSVIAIGGLFALRQRKIAQQNRNPALGGDSGYAPMLDTVGGL